MSVFLENHGGNDCPFRDTLCCKTKCELWHAVGFNDGKTVGMCVFNWMAFFLERPFNRVVNIEKLENKLKNEKRILKPETKIQFVKGR